MKDLFGQRLRSARLLAAMSQDQLVLAIDSLVTKNAIAKYERGEMMPGSKVLIVMAKALGIKTEYFFRPYTVEIQNVQFRKQKTLTATAIKTIQQKVTENLERYCEVEQLLNISIKFRNEISHITISNGEDVEAAADHLRKKWNLGTNVLHNVVGLLEDKGIKVIEIDAPTDFDGLSGHVGADPVIVVSQNKDRFIDRKRMTVLHELGHILLSFAKDIKQAAKERLCFRFAAAMMMPRATMIEEVGEKRKHISLAELILLKETYGMSIQGLIRRAYDLNILSEAKYKAWRAKIKLNEKEEDWGQYNGYEKTTRFIQLVYRAVSEEIISISKAADLANVKLAQFRDDFHVA